MPKVDIENFSFSDCPINSMALRDRKIEISFKKVYVINRGEFLNDILVIINFSDLEVFQHVQAVPFGPTEITKLACDDLEYLSEICEADTSKRMLLLSGFGVNSGRWTVLKFVDYMVEAEKASSLKLE